VPCPYGESGRRNRNSAGVYKLVYFPWGENVGWSKPKRRR
jgi:hypothetical protein